MLATITTIDSLKIGRPQMFVMHLVMEGGVLRISNAAIDHLGAARLEAKIFVGCPPKRGKDILLAGNGFRSVVNTMSADCFNPQECVNWNFYYPSVLNLAYCHIPAEDLYPDAPIVDAFAGALNALPHPLFVFASDLRCSVNLWALARANDWEIHKICHRCAEFDLNTDELVRRIVARKTFTSFDSGATVH